jgi:hypothetical protein
MKITTLLSALFLLSVTGNIVWSQHLVTGISAGVGSYAMNDLKSLNQAVTPSFASKLVSDFPPYLNYQYSLFLDEEKYCVGMFYSFQSTGSRISAKDYSGEYRFDLNVHSNNLGIYLSMNMLSKGNFRLSLYAKPGLAFSKLDLSEYFTILDTVLADTKLSCVATSFFLEPGVDFSVFILPSVTIGINAGYCLQKGGQNFHLDGEKESILVVPNTGQKIKPGWSGFRIGISLMYNLKLGKQDKK